ncbi:MAG TPA: hypothetical protein VNW29_03280 [Candidatus Sulfotelmatobacter sp.]|jgi:hypothetical protein|nr:hypothetical protein [Candidatus Sulfotelmatobacter sp.]
MTEYLSRAPKEDFAYILVGINPERSDLFWRDYSRFKPIGAHRVHIGKISIKHLFKNILLKITPQFDSNDGWPFITKFYTNSQSHLEYYDNDTNQTEHFSYIPSKSRFYLNTPLQQEIEAVGLHPWATQNNAEYLFREFNWIRFMNQQGFDEILVAFHRNYPGTFAFYSFIEGTTKTAEELTQEDLKAMIDFMLKLQTYKRPKTEAMFGHFALTASNPYYSGNDYIYGAFTRLQQAKIAHKTDPVAS